MKPDPATDSIRDVRRKISAEFGHDPRQVMAHYSKMEERLQAEGKYRFFDASETEPEQTVLSDKPTKP